MGKKILALFVCILLSVFICGCEADAPIEPVDFSLMPESAMSVHYIDVMQGDSILLESDEHYVLIDAGEKEYGQTVCNYLDDIGVETLDFVIATHPHSDHCGGLKKVIDTFECNSFITVETDQSTKTWIDVLLSVDENEVNYIDATVGETYSFGQASFEIMGPYSKSYDNYNDYSVVVKAVCGDTSFLFTGDAEKNAEKEMLENGADLKADVLKVGHHGSSTSSCDEFLDAVMPSYAVISCGIDNDYGHPHTEVLNALAFRGITTYRTDELSTIVAFSDKKDITFSYVNTEMVVEQTQEKEDSKPQTEKPTQKENTTTYASYVGNKNSKKLHLSTCQSVTDMNEKNKVFFDSKKEALDLGYTPCKNCNP